MSSFHLHRSLSFPSAAILPPLFCALLTMWPVDHVALGLCRWQQLLYINNFYPTDYKKQCVPWAWYLADDMQFSISEWFTTQPAPPPLAHLHLQPCPVVTSVLDSVSTNAFRFCFLLCLFPLCAFLSLQLACCFWASTATQRRPCTRSQVTERSRGREAKAQTDTHTNRQTDKQTNRQTDKQTHRQTDRRTSA